MKIDKILLVACILVIGFASCKKEDDDDGTVEFEENDRTEQQEIDSDSLIGYLETHYYNASDFVSNTNPSALDVVITEVLEGETPPDGSVRLIDELITTDNPDGKLESYNVVYEDTDYEYYVLRLNQGAGENSPTFADDIYVRYEGSTLDNDVFETILNIDGGAVALSSPTSNFIKGWRLVLPQFNVASSFTDNGDGTVEYLDHGAGVMFLPSGLGYFSTYINGDQYAPLIFKFDIVGMNENDHDGDGIPSYMEDLDGDGEFTTNFDDLEDETDDDTDGDGFANYIDADDDGDGVLTIYEDADGDGDPTNDKSDPDNTDLPDYLNPDISESNQED